MHTNIPTSSLLPQFLHMPQLFPWKGDSGWGAQMYTCGQFMLMYGKNHHNIVIILHLK